MKQKDYIKVGVKIVPPRGLDNVFKFVLPQFKHFPMSELLSGVHYFESFKDLKIAFGHPATIKQVNIKDEKYRLGNRQMVNEDNTITSRPSRDRKRNRKYDSESESSSAGSSNEQQDMWPNPNGRGMLTICHVCKEKPPIGDVHKCRVCNRSTHIWCGEGEGDEGFGQSCICNKCGKKPSTIREAKKSVTKKASSNHSVPEDPSSRKDVVIRLFRERTSSVRSEPISENVENLNAVNADAGRSMDVLSESSDAWEDTDGDVSEGEENSENRSAMLGAIHQNLFDESDSDESDEIPLRDVFEDATELPLTEGWNNIENEVKKLEFKSTNMAQNPTISTKETRITNRNVRNAEKPIDVFLELFPISLIEEIVLYTNMYKAQCGYSKKYKNITLVEMLRFIGLMIAHSVHAWTTGISNNWRTSAASPFLPGQWGVYLSRDRFKVISRFLHFCDNEAPHDKNDRHYKIRLVIERLNVTFGRCLQLGSHFSFDEGTWPTMSKYCPGKQFNPMKPHKWGLKLFMLCDSRSGYCTKFELYQGRKGINPLQDDEKTGPAAVLRNVKHLAGSLGVLYCDRYYTSVKLFLQLLSMGIYAVGTIKTNIRGFPKSLIMKKNSKSPRGTSKAMVANTAKGPIVAFSWKDTKPVHCISTGYMNNPCTIRRQVKRKKENFDCLEPVLQYQEHMGGVDLHDFLRMASFNVRKQMNFRKWYKMCFSASLDMALTNAYILWKRIQSKKTKRINRGTFLEDLCTQLLTFQTHERSTTRGSKSGTFIPSHEGTAGDGGHYIAQFKAGEGYSGAQYNCKRCFLCGTNKGKKTSYYCLQCDVPVCRTVHEARGKSCFTLLHTSPSAMTKLKKKKDSERARSQTLSNQVKAKNAKEKEEIQRKRRLLSPPLTRKRTALV